MKFVMTAMLLALGLSVAGCAGIGNAKKNLRAAVDTRQDNLNQCYAQALDREASAKGTVTVNLMVAEKSGQVESVEFIDAGFADQEMQTCVENAMIGIVIDPKPKASLKVEYQLEFTPEA